MKTHCSKTIWAISGFLFLVISAQSQATVYEVSTSSELDNVLHNTQFQDGDAVHISSGVYALSANWTPPAISAEITIFGDGAHTTTIMGTPSKNLRFISIRNANHHFRDLGLSHFKEAIFIRPKTTPPENAPIDLEVSLNRVKISDGFNAVKTLSTAPGRLRRITIKDSEFFDFDDIAINLDISPMDSVEVSGNHIRGAEGIGIRVGSDSAETNLDNYGQNYIIAHNHVEAIEPKLIGGFRIAKGIYVGGLYAVVNANIINNIFDPDCSGGACGDTINAIYSKASRTVISNNVIRDVGPGYAIDLKGQPRNEEGADNDPPGYNSIVANNQIFISDPSGYKYNGIKTKTDDVTIQGNHIEGINDIGILVQTTAFDDVSMLGNTLIISSASPGAGWGMSVFSNFDTYDYPGGRHIMAKNNRVIGSTDKPFIHRIYSSGQWNDDGIVPSDWIIKDNISH